MADLIDRAAAIDALESKAYRHTYLDQIVGIIEDLPSAQPKGYTDQLRWERDTAIQQLKELGYGLGEKPRTDGDTISRQAAIDALREYIVDNDMYDMDENVQGFNEGIDLAISELSVIPSAQPEQKWIPCSDCERRCDKWEHSKISQE